MNTGDMLRAAAGHAGAGGGGASGDEAWDFSDVANLWKDTALTSAVTADGDVIKGVTGIGAGGHKMSEATNGPTYKTGIINGLSVGRFDGSNDQLLAVGSGHAQPISIVAVFKLNATNQGQKYLIGETNNTYVIGCKDAGPAYIGGDGDTVGGVTADLEPHVFSQVLDGASTRFFVDGIEMTIGDSGTSAYGDIALGFLGGAGVGWCNADIGEVHMFHSAITDEARALLEGELAAKWGIAPALPSSRWDFSVPAYVFEDNAVTNPAEDDDHVQSVLDSVGAVDMLGTGDGTGIIYKANIQNGLHVGRFTNAVGNNLGCTHTLANGFTVVIAGKFASVAQSRRALFGGNSNVFGADFSSTSKLGLFEGSDHASSFTLDAAWHVFAAKKNGASSKQRVDGVEVYSGNVGSGAWDNPGVGNDGGGSQVFVGDIGEVLLFERVLTDAEIATVEAYLAAKWDI